MSGQRRPWVRTPSTSPSEGISETTSSGSVRHACVDAGTQQAALVVLVEQRPSGSSTRVSKKHVGQRLIQARPPRKPSSTQLRSAGLSEGALDGQLAVGRVLVARMGFDRHAAPSQLGQRGGIDRVQVADHHVGLIAEGQRGRRAAVGGDDVRLVQLGQARA